MSQSQRIEGNRVYCHVCDHEWDRAEGGLQCPACESEFVEIVSLYDPFTHFVLIKLGRLKLEVRADKPATHTTYITAAAVTRIQSKPMGNKLHG